MIVNGGSRSNGAFFARHLTRVDENERVTLAEMRGFSYAEDVPTAFEELRNAAGMNCKNWFYHANINTATDERLTPEQWGQATDMLEDRLGLTGQPRFVVEHEKEGRVHRHVVWSRTDADTRTTIHDGHNYRKHEDAAREIEAAFDLAPVERCLTRDKEEIPRQERRPADWESFRAAESKIDPQAMKAELTELWQHSDSGPAFAAALEERGYILVRGDKRDFCVIDADGDEHSLSRRLAGVKAADLRARLADVDRDALPSVAEGRERARRRIEQPAEDDGGNGRSIEGAVAALDPLARSAPQPVGNSTEEPVYHPPPELPPFEAIMAETRRLVALEATAVERKERDEAATAEQSAFAQAMRKTRRIAAREAAAEAKQPEAARRRARWQAWRATMQRHLSRSRGKLAEWWREYFHFGQPATPEKGHER